MGHDLIYTIIASLVTAFVFGLTAKRLKLPAIFGYIIAGVVVGPHTPGFVANVELAQQLAEIGIILLMFGVGLHFSLDDLISVRRVAIPGALSQMIMATFIGAAVCFLLNYTIPQGLLFGFALSVASTVVLLRTLEQRNLVDSKGGKIAIGWLIVEDIAMVLAIVLLPVVGDMMKGTEEVSPTYIFTTTLIVLIKVAGFFALMLVLGKRFLPWVINAIEKVRSEELVTLGILAIAMGFATLAYVVFDASLALGAFLAGMVLTGSEIGRRAAEKTTSLRDTFTILFFVSVGMLFQPDTLIKQPFGVLLTFLIIVVAKTAVALFIARLFRLSKKVSYTVGLGLAQIGEFSFILGGMSLSHGLIPLDLYNLIIAGALLSIVANPFLFNFFYDNLGKQHSLKHPEAPKPDATPNQ